jgi:hypothetical protein
VDGIILLGIHDGRRALEIASFSSRTVSVRSILGFNPIIDLSCHGHQSLWTIRLLFGVYWMNSGRAASNTPVRSHPATIASVGVCTVARFDGERARGNSRFDDMRQGIFNGAQM